MNVCLSLRITKKQTKLCLAKKNETEKLYKVETREKTEEGERERERERERGH